jgi:glycerate 2-kinase
VTTKLLDDALAISEEWRSLLDLRELTETQLRRVNFLDETIDVVAIGKASRSMTRACREILGERVQRVFMVVDETDPANDLDAEVVVGEHPLPGEGSAHAGERLLTFLSEPTQASCTLFLISGGASSLCARPQSPVDLAALHDLFASALESGMNITELNRLRAATSSIAGGAVLRYVRTVRSTALIMVDNVVSGATWVASALTYEYQPSEEEVTDLVEKGQLSMALATKVREASERRRTSMGRPLKTTHENLVVAEPTLLLDAAVRSARERGYRVVRWGSDVHGNVHDVVDDLSSTLRKELATPGPFCVVGVGEVTVQVRGAGTGGRCQEFAWAMADVLATINRFAVFVARASDGRDFVSGVAGGWVDGATTQHARTLGIDWAGISAQNDTFNGLSRLGQLIVGSGTGWNLCDLYFTVVA